MKKLLAIILFQLFVLCVHASSQKDVLYGLAKNYAVEMWNQGKNGNPTMEMNNKAYDFYFKHLFDTYSGVYKKVEKTKNKDDYYKLYWKVCDLLKWKSENKEFSHFKKYVRLKQQIETDIQSMK